MSRPVSPKTILNRAARIVERGWTRNAFARFGNNHDALVDDPRAVKFCASGAIIVASRELGGVTSPYQGSPLARASTLAQNEAFETCRDSLTIFNDKRAKNAAEVARLLRRAARRDTP